MSGREDQGIDWREMRCEVHVNKKTYRESRKGEPMRALSAYNKRKCRCESCVLAHKLRKGEYREENREKIRDYHARYREENLEKFRDYSARYREENPERIRAINAKYYQQNSEELRARQAAYRKTDAGRACQRRVNLRRRSADEAFFGAMTREEHARFYEISRFWRADIETHVDHVVPVSLGGTSHPDNLVVFTAAENKHKSDTHPLDWPVHTVPLAGRFHVLERN